MAAGEKPIEQRSAMPLGAYDPTYAAPLRASSATLARDASGRISRIHVCLPVPDDTNSVYGIVSLAAWLAYVYDLALEFKRGTETITVIFGRTCFPQ